MFMGTHDEMKTPLLPTPIPIAINVDYLTSMCGSYASLGAALYFRFSNGFTDFVCQTSTCRRNTAEYSQTSDA